MLSSKCCQVVSPSPFKFFAALMPPCAQTECERFTGTMENRSTVPPFSAILITAESPARPPPTTIIFGAAAIVSLAAFCNLPVHYGGSGISRLLRMGPERGETGESRAREHEEKSQAHCQKPLARPLPGHDAPLRAKQPDAIREMPGSGDQTRNIKQEKRGVKHFVLHLAE